MISKTTMEFDEFLTGPRWQILDLIIDEPSSPVKISEKINTSVAYVSQQLKLLEAAGIVTKTRTKASVAGEPRIIYSIKEDVIFITSLIKGFPEKKKISPTTKQQIILKIWMLDDDDLEYLTEKLFWKIESNLEDIEEIYIDVKKSEIIIISKKSSINSKVQSFLKEIKNKINCKVLQNSTKGVDGLYNIYHSSWKNGEKEEA